MKANSSLPIAIFNAQVVLPEEVVAPSSIVVTGKRIVAIGKGSAVPRGVVKINARGNFVAPGFIDLHIHGDVQRISRQQAAGGTTGFLATLHPARPKFLLKNVAQTLAQRGAVSGARVLGLRLEGPFINREFCGALPRAALREPSLNEASRIIKAAVGALKIVVLAPELKRALKLIRMLRRHKIVASLGHTGATYQQALRGIDAGARFATHTFNRMRVFDHREPGALGAVLTDQRVICEVIPEENHLHPAALKLLLAAKGVDKVVLITDSTTAQAVPSKRRCGDVCRLKDGTLYGTALTLNRALEKAVKVLDLSLAEAVRLVALNPARVLGIDKRKGSLAVGKDADLVIFDRSFRVMMTMVEGNIV